jgi:hypothetical protein
LVGLTTVVNSPADRFSRSRDAAFLVTKPSELPGPARADQRRSELLDAESHRAAEVDVREVRRADAAQPVVFDLIPSRLSLSTTSCIRAVFQASTMFVSRACEPEIAFISSRRRPRSGATLPEYTARCS